MVQVEILAAHADDLTLIPGSHPHGRIGELTLTSPLTSSHVTKSTPCTLSQHTTNKCNLIKSACQSDTLLAIYKVAKIFLCTFPWQYGILLLAMKIHFSLSVVVAGCYMEEHASCRVCILNTKGILLEKC